MMSSHGYSLPYLEVHTLEKKKAPKYIYHDQDSVRQFGREKIVIRGRGITSTITTGYRFYDGNIWVSWK